MQPPKKATQFFHWYCKTERQEELLGDLEELYFNQLERNVPKWKVNLCFWWNVIRCFKPYAVDFTKPTHSNLTIMIAILSNNLKTIFRNVKKHTFFASLNVTGLMLSFVAFMFVTVYVSFESSYEQFHSKADQIYRVSYASERQNGEQFHWAKVPFDFINQLPDEVAGVDQLVRFQNQEQKFFKIENRRFKEDHVYHVDPNVFEVFDHQLLLGEKSSALSDPFSVVLTRSIAEKYFGSIHDAMEKEVQVASEWSYEMKVYRVTGVMEDVPANTHLPVDIFLSYEREEQRTWWGYIYLLVDEGITVAELNEEMDAFIGRHEENPEFTIDFPFQPLKSIHLHSNLARELVPGGNPQNVKIIAIIGVLVLLIGVINFTNLNNTMSLIKNREVGVRKVLGAVGFQVSSVAVLESVLFSTMALLTAFLATYLLFPVFQNFTGVAFNLNIVLFSGGMFSIALLIGLVAGIYPSLVARKVKPIHLLKKNRVKHSGGRFTFKHAMLALQFAIAILLIVSSVVARNQFAYLAQQNESLNAEQVLVLPRVPNPVKDGFRQFKNEANKLSAVKSVSASLEPPSREIRDGGPFVVTGLHDSPEKAPAFDIQIMDHDFIELMNLELLTGTHLPSYISERTVPAFTEDYDYKTYLGEQKRAYLINETAARELGFTDVSEAIGRQAYFNTDDIFLEKGPIVGIIKDYHQETLKNAIDPTIYVYEPLWLNTFLLRIESTEMRATLDEIESIWMDMFPNYPMEYHFLDDLYNRLYQKDRKQFELLKLLSGLALFIAFLGIFGLVAYSLQVRMKELAIRKVMGANMISLTSLLANSYLLLLLVGAIIAVPISYVAINSWLEEFVYRVNISPFSYLVTLFLVAVLLFLTIAVQTVRASTANPSTILRDE